MDEINERSLTQEFEKLALDIGQRPMAEQQAKLDHWYFELPEEWQDFAFSLITIFKARGTIVVNTGVFAPQARSVSLVSKITVQDQRSSKVDVYLSYGFGTVFLTALLVLAVAFPEPTDFQQDIFRATFALSGSAFAAVIPGSLDATINLKMVSIRAAGAIAVFAILFFFSPAG